MATANLQNANLQNANLQNAGLQDANLRGANLQDADLRGADLYCSNVPFGDFTDTNLQGTKYNKDTNFTGGRGRLGVPKDRGMVEVE